VKLPVEVAAVVAVVVLAAVVTRQPAFVFILMVLSVVAVSAAILRDRKHRHR
jgi:hypothetical protein